MRYFAVGAAAVILGMLLGCDHSPTTPGLNQLTFDVVSGDRQTAMVGTQLAPLIVKVASGGNPVALQVLNFRVVSGGGSVYGGTELTDAHGIAQELWTLGTKASDVQKVEVRAVESSTGAEKVFATFTATALPAAAETLFTVAGNSQSAAVGSAVAIPPAVEVTDQYRNPISGASVTFAVGPASGSATGLSQTTNASGIATVGSWTLSGTAGSNTLTAASGTLNGSPVTFTATATGPPGLNITNYRGDGQTQSAGGSVLVAPAAQVTDQSGHPVAGVQVVFSVTAGGGSINGATQVTDANGIASVGAWTLGAIPGVNELKATFNTGVSRGSTIFVATATPGNFWTTKASMSIARNDLSAGAVNGLMYAIGGKTGNTCSGLTTVEAFDPATNAWTTVAPLPTGRFNPATTSVGGRLYVVGGDLGCGVRSSELDAYDPSRGQWTVQASMPTARSGPAAAAINGLIYVAGGVAGNSTVTTVEAYDPARNTWMTKAPMNTPVARVAAGVVNGTLYVVGQGPTGAMVTQAYDASADAWVTKAPMPVARSDLAGGVANGVLYIVGGRGPTGATTTVEAYDPAADAWSSVAPTPTARVRHAVTTVNGVLYAVGGGEDASVVGTNQAYQR